MKKFLIYIQVMVLMLVSVSCEDFLDVNVDPNNPTEVSPDLILPVGQHYTAQYQHGNRRSNHLGNMMMFNWSETFGFSWYPDEFAYLVTSSFYSALFDQAYQSPLKQYHLLTQLAPEYDYYKAIGMIMKAYHYQILVDLYGDIPYSEALGRSENPTPVYDDAETVYDDLIVKLTEAIAVINDAPAGTLEPGADDALFGGDMDSWKQFANSIKVRILARQSDMASKQAYITTELAAIATEGSGFITSDAVVNPGYLNEAGKQNPYWAGFGASVDGTVTLTNDATCATQYVLDLLAGNNDPRIDYIYELPAGGHLGVEQGVQASKDYSADNVSNIGPGITTGPTMGSIIMTVAETNFNLAEMALKGLYTGDTDENLFNAAVQASFNTLGAPDYNAYILAKSYAVWTNKLEGIITEKWIALNGINALQSWFDYSRTGYPAGLPISTKASTPDRPVRLMYPASEVTGNSANIPDQMDPFNDKIFWAN